MGFFPLLNDQVYSKSLLAWGRHFLRCQEVLSFLWLGSIERTACMSRLGCGFLGFWGFFFFSLKATRPFQNPLSLQCTQNTEVCQRGSRISLV